VPAQKIGDDTVASIDYKSWSLYGAPWLHPVATRRKTPSRENGEIKRKSVAVRCDQLPRAAHGKEGVSGSSPEEGLKKALEIGAFGCHKICSSSSLLEYGALSGAPSFSGAAEVDENASKWRSALAPRAR
jgi:hypothetical protein